MKSKTRKRRRRKDTLVLNLLILVALVLFIFEGRLIFTMITHRLSMNSPVVSDDADKDAPSGDTLTDAPEEETASSGKDSQTSSASNNGVLAGLPGSLGAQSSDSGNSPAERLPTVSNPNSSAIVPKASVPVDDSYFSDAAFIGDSRMEGFRNASGITQGKFFTSVGMSLSSMANDAIISDPSGSTITVAAALSGGDYNKIYIMLGANDLGEYDWNAFHDGFVSVTQRFLEIQPNAVIYICSCIYVEESKVTTGSYVNNANVDKINEVLLSICEEEGYHYLDLNEFLSNGYGALIEGASSDGVHIYPDYCKQMLDYLKNHYVEVPDAEADAENSTEKEDTAEKSKKKEKE